MIDDKTLKTLEYDKVIHELTKHAQTVPGRVLCENLIPAGSYDLTINRQQETDHAIKVVFERGVLPLSGASDIRQSVARSVTGAVLSGAELLRIAAFLRVTSRVKSHVPMDNTLPRDEQPYLIYDRIRLLNNLKSVLIRLEECIAGEDEIHDRATDRLYQIRRRISETQTAVKDMLNRLMRGYASSLQDQLVTIRGDRYVLPVKAEHRGDLPGIVHDTSSSGATLFIEPMAVVELNNKIRELRSRERDEIEQILQELSGLISLNSESLISDTAIIAELDLAMAKAGLALKMKAMPPVMNREGKIRVKAARHPLIPSDRVVPIDFELGMGFHTLVITGPNTGGKTVTLKTCGLLCLMSMAGLQIPAGEGSLIAFFDQILADIGDEQSIEQDLSTFSSHLKQLIRITEQARPGTLVLVDELGSGTDPSEGAALAISILDHLHRRGCLTIATTHYKELKGYAIQTDDVENACCEFDTETLRPTYKLLIGVPGVSNAFAISRRLGLMPSIIENAIGLISEEGMKFEELVQSIEKSRSEADRMHLETQRLYQEASRLKEKLDSQITEMEQKRRDYLHKAREEARELYQEAEQDIQIKLTELKKQSRRQDAQRRHNLMTQTRQGLRSSLGQLESQIGEATLQVEGKPLPSHLISYGHDYFAPHLGITGKLIDGPDARGQVTLQTGSMQVKVSADTLRLPAPVRKKNVTRSNNNLTMKVKINATTEIKLLGQTVEEACANLDQFLDQAVLSGLHQLRIVHGKGTGALRTAVHKMLKSDSRVSNFQLAAFGEGDSGVTIVQLK